MGLGHQWIVDRKNAQAPQENIVTIPNLTYGQYQPTAPINLANLFPVLGNQSLQNLYYGQTMPLPSQPMTPVANMYGANRFLSPSMMSGLLNFTPTQMTASPAQAPAMTTSNA
jgi:hypothetical protein